MSQLMVVSMLLFFGLFARFAPNYLSGLKVTLSLVGLSILLGAALSVPVAFARGSRNPLLAWPAYAYVYFFRGTPLLVQIFLVYYGLSQFAAVRASPFWVVLREPFWCALIAFSLNTAAYTAEIVRGAVQAVPRGQVEAAKAIGMSRLTRMRRIVMPQAVRIGLPAYGNEIILMLKASAVVYTVTLMDIMGVIRTINSRTYQYEMFFLVAGLIYLIITLLFTWLFRRLEIWLKVDASRKR